MECDGFACESARNYMLEIAFVACAEIAMLFFLISQRPNRKIPPVKSITLMQVPCSLGFFLSFVGVGRGAISAKIAKLKVKTSAKLIHIFIIFTLEL